MEKKRSLHRIFHVVLSFAAFLIVNRLIVGAFSLVRMPVDAWAADLAAFLTAFPAALFLYRQTGRSENPVSWKPCSRLLAFVHVGYGLFWLVLAMYGVLFLFPVEGEGVSGNLLSGLLTAVCIHPVLEEILFRRVYLWRLAEAALPETVRETAEENEKEPHPVPGRSGILFAVLTQAVLFGLVHPGGGGMLYGFAGGVILGILMVRTGRLWVPVVCHMLANLRSLLYPMWDTPVQNAADAVLLTVGLVCGILFWVHCAHTRKLGAGEPEKEEEA